MNIRNDNLTDVRRSGFTLVELLIVIAIIAVLASMAIGVMASARNDANVAATQARMNVIEQIMLEQLEEYEVRRLPVPLAAIRAAVGANPSAPVYVQTKNLKRRIIADLLNAEFPTPIPDNTAEGGFAANNDIGNFPTNRAVNDVDLPADNQMGFLAWLNDKYPAAPGPLMINLLSSKSPSRVLRWRKLKTDPSDPNSNADPFFNLPGEYLHAILSGIEYQGSTALDAIGNQAVADTDGDGYLEVVDAWGEQMGMRIFQVNLDFTQSNLDIDLIVDADADWSDRPPYLADGTENTSRIPRGFKIINPTIPRTINDIRIEVTSQRMLDIRDL